MIRFLHIVYDDKFTKGMVLSFNREPEIENSYIYYNWTKKKELRFIQEVPNVKIITKRGEMALELRAADYDVLYLHGVPLSFWFCLKYIPKDKIIIWWSWGYDIYSPTFWGTMNNYITMEILKPLTKIALSKSRTSFYKRLWVNVMKNAINIKWHFFKDKFIRRVDYFQPVLSVEYYMMKSYKGFRAKEFYRPNTTPSWTKVATVFPKTEAAGAIQIGNSSSEVSNHLDVWADIEKYIHKDRKVIMPLSYGGPAGYSDYVKKEIKLRHSNIEFLDSYLPQTEYYNLVGQCTYFVHGAIRQHAMGNIFRAISQGEKIFLYRDSVDYRFLKENGFVVFAIEEINERSFLTPLSQSEHEKNLAALQRDAQYKCDTGLQALSEIRNRISEKTKI